MNLPELRTLAIEPLDGGIAVLRVSRPDRMNAQTVTMFGEYGIAARALRDSGLRAPDPDRSRGPGVLRRVRPRRTPRHHPPRGARLPQVPPDRRRRHHGHQAPALPGHRRRHGAAVGGGLALALAADIRLTAPTAKFSAAFVRVGLSMGELGVSFTLSRLVGPGRAAEIGYTGRVVGAEEAVRIGLANRIVPSEHLFDEALAMATVIAAHPPGGVRLSKRAIQRNQEITSYAAALELENRGQALLAMAEDP